MAILEVRGLVKFYGRRKVVDGVNFDVNLGEVVGLLGSNGAGKTTSFRMTTGQVTPNEGKVLFNGVDVSHLPMYKRARLGMGYLAQETSVFRKLTVEQNILAILEVQPFYRSLKRKLTRQERFKKCDEVLERFGISHLRKNNAARLSGGERRRLEIARCLVCDPLLILLDEPFTGIDPHTVADIQKIVRDLREFGIGILVTDHHVRETLTITDRSYIIKAGRVLTEGTPQQIIKDEVAIREYIGNSFAEDPFAVVGNGSRTSAAKESAPTPAPAPVSAPPAAPMAQVLEQEKAHRLVEQLRGDEHTIAAVELLQLGAGAVPALLEALERRDVEMRRRACDVLRAIFHGSFDFDPYAPEQQRRQQLAALRDRHVRRAG